MGDSRSECFCKQGIGLCFRRVYLHWLSWRLRIFPVHFCLQICSSRKYTWAVVTQCKSGLIKCFPWNIDKNPQGIWEGVSFVVWTTFTKQDHQVQKKKKKKGVCVGAFGDLLNYSHLNCNSSGSKARAANCNWHSLCPCPPATPLPPKKSGLSRQK